MDRLRALKAAATKERTDVRHRRHPRAHEVAPLILESLKRLEYRGYDSAGHRHAA